MSKVSGSIPNFANGISQQAQALRLATQGELQVNAYSTVVDGLRKRPPTQRVAFLGDNLPHNAYTHKINRDVDERYEVILSPAGIRVFDLNTGVEKSVTATDGFDYLLTSDDNAEELPYRTMTIGDYTFIANTEKVVEMEEGVIQPISPSEAMVHTLAGNYGKDYKILIDDQVVAWYRTPDGTSAAQSPAVDTSYITRRLATGETVALETTVNNEANGNWTWKSTDTNLNATGITAANGWTVKVFKGTIYIKKDDGTPFTIGVEDGYNGHAMKAIQHTVQDFGDLPSYTEEGVTVEVTGTVNTEFDNYFVQFGKQSEADDSSTPGVWREVPAPGSLLRIERSTMPHVLIRKADGTFSFEQAEWNDRVAGDDEIAPGPSFIGNKISNIIFFKNRLGFLSGENTILSRSGSYFDWWRATATALLDDDPIDVASTDSGVSILRSAVGMGNRLILFADQRQFSFQGNELLTPKTASIQPSTAYHASSVAAPVATGDAVYFPVDRGQFSTIREYRIDPNGEGASAGDITSHVPQYIPGTIRKMASSTHEDILIAHTNEDPSSVYVYKYYWSGDKKLQASWSKWEFPEVERVIDFGFINSELFFLFERDEGATLEKMEVQPGGSDPYSDIIVHMDDRVLVTPPVDATYDAFNDKTTFTTPHDMSGKAIKCVTAATSTDHVAGLEYAIDSVTSTEMTVNGDVRGLPLYLGILYDMEYEMSTIYIRSESRSGGVSAVTEGRLQLLQLLIQYSRTAYFRVEITPLARPTQSYVTNGRLMGDPLNVTDKVTLGSGTARFPVLSKNERVTIKIINDSYLPCSILSAEWIGKYSQKSKRI